MEESLEEKKQWSLQNASHTVMITECIPHTTWSEKRIEGKPRQNHINHDSNRQTEESRLLSRKFLLVPQHTNFFSSPHTQM